MNSSPMPQLPAIGADVDLGIEVERMPSGVAVVAVAGDADLHSAPALRECLERLVSGGATRLVVDLSETTFVDSMMLGVLLSTMKQLRQSNGDLVLVAPNAEIRRILEITMLDQIFVLHRTRADALAVDAPR